MNLASTPDQVNEPVDGVSKAKLLVSKYLVPKQRTLVFFLQ
jgi:hypothetical protein